MDWIWRLAPVHHEARHAEKPEAQSNPSPRELPPERPSRDSDDTRFKKGTEAAPVLWIPVGDRADEAPIRERIEMSMRIVVMQRKVEEHMQQSADTERRAYSRLPHSKDDPADEREWNGIEYIKKILPLRLKIQRAPYMRPGRTHPQLLP